MTNEPKITPFNFGADPDLVILVSGGSFASFAFASSTCVNIKIGD